METDKISLLKQPQEEIMYTGPAKKVVLETIGTS